MKKSWLSRRGVITAGNLTLQGCENENVRLCWNKDEKTKTARLPEGSTDRSWVNLRFTVQEGTNTVAKMDFICPQKQEYSVLSSESHQFANKGRHFTPVVLITKLPRVYETSTRSSCVKAQESRVHTVEEQTKRCHFKPSWIHTRTSTLNKERSLNLLGKVMASLVSIHKNTTKLSAHEPH